MLKELLDRIDNKRDVKIEVEEYGVYNSRKTEAIYNDATSCYQTRGRNNRTLDVSSVNSFIDFIDEELDRCENKTGKLATVVVNDGGGSFCADDDFGGKRCDYERSLTTLWKTLKSVANCKLNHEELLTTLQRLRPCISNFEDLYLKLLDIRTIGRSEMISNPVFMNGEAGCGYKIKYKLQNGVQDESELPSNFICVVPYAKGRPDVTYNIPIELMFLNNGSGRIEVLFQCSELERIEEKALQDEVDYLKEKLSKYSDLLVLLNY